MTREKNTLIVSLIVLAILILIEWSYNATLQTTFEAVMKDMAVVLFSVCLIFVVPLLLAFTSIVPGYPRNLIEAITGAVPVGLCIWFNIWDNAGVLAFVGILTFLGTGGLLDIVENWFEEQTMFTIV